VWSFTTSSTKIQPHFVSAAPVHTGILEVYCVNGSRVMEQAYGVLATKVQSINTTAKSLAKGYYLYRFRNADARVEIVGRLIK
jgi:hypothetical protein